MIFDPVIPWWLIFLLVTILLAGAVALEWQRPLRFRAWRIFCCLLMAAALYGMLSRPAFLVRSAAHTVLLTSEYSHAVADSLRRNWPGAKFYSLDDRPYSAATKLSSYRELSGLARGESPLNISAVVGNGLPSYALDSLHKGFDYFPSRIPDGITGISVSSDLQRNKEGTLRGTYVVAGIPARLYFLSPAGKIDSLDIRSRTGDFRFSFKPRVSGNVTYALTLTDSAKQHTEETVPLSVRSFAPLNILMLPGYPTFEMQHLRNFLSDRGHRLAVRTAVSRDVYRTEFANRAGMPLSKLTPALLEEFDLIITDVTAFRSASSSDRAVLETSVRNGLGILTIVNDTPLQMSGRELLPFPFTPARSDTVGIVVNNKRYTLPAANLRPRAFSGTPLMTTRSGVLSGYVPVRKGTSGFQLLQETYSLLLSGDSVAYGTIWSPLIESISRVRRMESSIAIISAFPAVVDEPVDVRLLSGTTPRLLADDVPVPVREDPLIDGVWYTTVWPRHAGWQTLHAGGDTLSFYAFDNDRWRALRIADQQERNTLAAQKGTDVEDALTPRSVPALIFFLTFLVSIGFLWVAPRL